MSSFMQDTRDPEEELVLLELLGEGSYGAVYRAERRSDGTEVAVKIIPADNPADLLKEVDIMMACTSPFIVRLHDCYYKDNEAWLVMDFVGGGSVCDILEACEVTLSEAEARECTAWTVLALDYLHSNRKLHRDVKAGNILLTMDGRAKLADFGVSKEVNTMANKAQTAIGTPYWMAPEVIQEVPYDGQADIWSLAITCIEMVEGHPPLNNVHPMRAIFMIPSKPSPALSEPAKWSLEFNDFLARCLEKKPEDRPSSRALLRHPWIANSVESIQTHGGTQGSAIIADLVGRHLPALTSFREDASEAKANQANEENENTGGNKTATLRRLSSRGSGNNRGQGTPEARSPQRQAQQSTYGSGARGRPLTSEQVSGQWTEGCSSRDDSYSSSGSVIRVAIDPDAGSECSSAGSVVRLPLDTGEESDCSSDGSVIRVPISEPADDAVQGGVWGGRTALGPPEASGPERSGLSRQGSSVRFASDQSAWSPSDAMKSNSNVQAAAKYFALKGGTDGAIMSNTTAAATDTAGGNRSMPTMGTPEGNPQAKALLDELGRLDVQFANDLATLRHRYDARKAELQTKLRACLDSSKASSAAQGM